MQSDRKPDETVRLTIDGHNVLAYSFGSGPEVLFCINGGPGLPCDYVRESHSHWPTTAIGSSSMISSAPALRPAQGQVLWTVERYVAEVETVRQALRLGKRASSRPVLGRLLGVEYALPIPRASRPCLGQRPADTPFTCSIWPGCAARSAPRRSP